MFFILFNKLFNAFLVLCVWSLRKSELWLFYYENFLSKFIDTYCTDTVLSLILLVSEMLKIPRPKFEAHFLKKRAFVTNRCLAQDAFEKNVLEKQKTFQNTRQHANSYMYKFFIISYILQSYSGKWAILVTKMHCPTQPHISSP